MDPPIERLSSKLNHCSKQVVLDEVPIPTPAPVAPMGAYGGIPPEIPGLIEAEEFDYGGQGVGYSDTDAGNIGGVSEEKLNQTKNRKYTRARFSFWTLVLSSVSTPEKH